MSPRHRAPPPSLWHPPRLAPTASADAPAGDAGTEGEGRAGAPPAGAQYVPVPPWEQGTPPAAQAGGDGALVVEQAPPRAARPARGGLQAGPRVRWVRRWQPPKCRRP